MQIVRSGEAQVVAEEGKYLARLPDHIQAGPGIDAGRAAYRRVRSSSTADRQRTAGSPSRAPSLAPSGGDVRRAVERSRLDERGGQDGQQFRCGS